MLLEHSAVSSNAALELIVALSGLPAETPAALYLASARHEPLVLLATSPAGASARLPLMLREEQLEALTQTWVQDLTPDNPAPTADKPPEPSTWIPVVFPFTMPTGAHGTILIASRGSEPIAEVTKRLGHALSLALPLLAAHLEITRLQDLLENLPIALCIIDAARRVLHHTVNFALLTEEQEPNGKLLDQLLPSYPSWQAILETTTKYALPATRETVLANRSTIFRARVWLRPLFTQDGSLHALVVTLLPRKLWPYAPRTSSSQCTTTLSHPDTCEQAPRCGLLLTLDALGTPEIIDSETMQVALSWAIERVINRLEPQAVHLLTNHTILFFFPATERQRLQLQHGQLQRELSKQMQMMLTWPFSLTFNLDFIPNADELWKAFQETDLASFHISISSIGSHSIPSPSLAFPNLERLSHHNLFQSLYLSPVRFALQPIFPLRDNKPLAEELLARFQVGKRLISFGHYLQYAAHPQRVAAIDAAALALAHRLTRHGQKRVHVNLSLRSLLYAELEETLQQCSDLSGIVLEVTEGWASTYDLLLVRERLEELIKHGARFALDDVGALDQTLSLLFYLPVQMVKLAGSLVNRLPDDHKLRKMLLHFVRFLHEQGIEVAAEHVETEHMLVMLQDLEIDYVQGFLLGQPKLLDV